MLMDSSLKNARASDCVLISNGIFNNIQRGNIYKNAENKCIYRKMLRDQFYQGLIQQYCATERNT